MTPEEQVEYDTLYNKGFDDKDTETETLEQPIEDSIEEEVEEQEEVETTEESTEEEESQEIEETTETKEEQPEEDDTYLEVQRHGETIKMTKEEAKLLASYGFDYTSKTQDLAEKRKLLDIIDGKTPEELQALVDASNGNKEALGVIAKQANIDIYDVDTEDTTYKPVVEQKNYALDDAIEAIQKDTDNAPILDRWIDALPKSVYAEFQRDPKLLIDVHSETKAGIAQKVMPDVFKEMAINPTKTFKEAYLSVRETVVSKPESKPQAPRETIKKATVPKKTVSKHTKDHTDIWEDDELYAKMQKMRRGY